MGHRKRRRKRRIILRDEKWTNTAKTLGKHRFTEAWTWNVRKARSSFPRRERFCEMLRVVAKTKAEIVLLSEMQEDTPSIKWIKSREINGVLVQAAVSSYGIRGQKNWSELGCQRVCQPLWNCAPDEFCHTATASERNKIFEPPQGVSDDSSAEESGVRRSSRQTKSKEPKPFGDPVKHFIKEVSEELSGGALLKAHSRNTGRD